jgi:hypothetical protein
MTILEAFIANGNELAFVAGGAAAFGKPVYGRLKQVCSPSIMRWM